MNNIFNFERFRRYFATDARSCAANYGMSMLLISMMGLIIYAGTIVMGLLLRGEWCGPGFGFRWFVFTVCLCCLIFTMPAKCYGRITEKRFGTQWLMIPASSFEKSLSMIILNTILMPLLMCTVYFGIDAILCELDGTCGTSLGGSFKAVLDKLYEISIATEYDMFQFPTLADLVKQVTCPWLYVDDIIQMFLITLLGAVLFKKNKAALTTLFYFVITTILGLAVMPLTIVFFNEFANMNFQANTPEALNQLFGMGVFKHVALIDTVSDTLINLGLMAAIYFRVKTLKH